MRVVGPNVTNEDYFKIENKSLRMNQGVKLQESSTHPTKHYSFQMNGGSYKKVPTATLQMSLQ